MLNKSKVQEEFHNYGIQISRSTVKSINDFIYKLVEFTIQNAIDNNVKRITRNNLNNLIAVFEQIKSEKKQIENISKFYNEILPNLGWKSENNTKFVRGKDSLELQYSSENQTVIVKFKLIQK